MVVRKFQALKSYEIIINNTLTGLKLYIFILDQTGMVLINVT